MSALPRFATEGSLSSALTQACQNASAPGAAIAIIDADGIHAAVHGCSADGERFSPATPLPFSCAARLFVGTLVAALIHDGRVGLDDPITEQLQFGSVPTTDYFAGITVRHLLSQSDGIGYRPMESVPVLADGYIDLDALAQVICADRRLFPPGRYYSTSRCGFGLLGKVVERHLQRPFGVALQEELLRYLAPAQRQGAGRSVDRVICPASGKGLSLSTCELADFLRLQLDPAGFAIPLFAGIRDFSLLFEQQLVCEGWSGGVIGSALAWRNFPGGWVGQNGNSDEQTIIVRLNPADRTAFVFLCRAVLPVAYAVLGRLLGARMQEFNPSDAPRLLTAEERRGLATDDYVGVFGNAFRRIEIRTGPSKQLEINVSRRSASGSLDLGSGALLPATRDIFFIPPPNAYGVWFVQALPSATGGKRDVVWDGWNLWPRLTVA